MKTFLSEVKTRIVANKISICILIVCVLFIGFLMNQIIVNNYNGEQEYTYNYLTEGSGRTPTIENDRVVSQKFIITHNNLYKMSILTLMPGISTDSNVNVRVIETKGNKEIYNENINLGSVKDGQYFETFVENQPKSKNKEYEIIITGIDGTELNSVQFPYSSTPNGLLKGAYVEGEMQENNFVFKISYINYISNKIQIIAWASLLILGIVCLCLFSNDNDLILNNINFNFEFMKNNFKNNWYWLISIFFAYTLFRRETKIEYYFLIVSFLFSAFILTQVKNLSKKVKEISGKIKVFSFISTSGICYYTYNFQLLKARNLSVFEKIDDIVLDKFAFIVTILASFIIFALVTILINYVIQKIKNIFEDITVKEKVMYIFILLLIFGYTFYLFSNTTVPYGREGALFDVLFTSDSGRLVTDENAYLSLYHGENDLRQPLYAVFAMPFVGFGYAISLLFPFASYMTPFMMNCMQIVLLFIANLMLAKLLKLKSVERVLFMILSFCTYMSLLFTIMMEQYLVAYFWLITFIYLVCNKKQDEICFVATSGTLLTNIILAPYMCDEISFNKIKELFISIIKAVLVFIIFIIIFNRIDLLENLLLKQEQYNTFIDNEINFSYKMKAYTNFIENCFTYPKTYITSTPVCEFSFQSVVNNDASLIGIGIIICTTLGFLLNRKDKFSQISFAWCIFSFILLGLIGWGTAENGLILYSLYFGWPFLVLICKLFQYIENKTKIKYLTIFCILILVGILGYTNFNGIKILFDFAFKYYKI